VNNEIVSTAFIKEVNDNAAAHGFHDPPASFGEIIALCHSELSEALQDYRNGINPAHTMFDFSYCGDVTRDECAGCLNRNPKCGKPKPLGIPVELADCIIRILDYCGHAGIDINEALRIKHEFNKTRPYKHGKANL
jgi:hypothetical protein